MGIYHMLRAKSYKKKLKKSQIKLRKHKTYSKQKKQKGGMPFKAPDGKTYQTPEEYERWAEIKKVFEERKRRNASIDIADTDVIQVATDLRIPIRENMKQEDIDSMVSLLTTHMGTFDPNKVSVRDYIEGNIFGDKKPGEFRNLKQIIDAALAITGASPSGAAGATAAAAAEEAAVAAEQKLEQERREDIAAKEAVNDAVTPEQKRAAQERLK